MHADSTVLVTGGAGFIGSNFIHQLRSKSRCRVVNLDALTYAGNPDNLADLASDSGYSFVHGSITDADCVAATLRTHRPVAIVNFAAESHVDRSIDNPLSFVETNVVGVQILLDAAREFTAGLNDAERQKFRFLQVSTDEVFGSLGATGTFSENTHYAPNSPYAASKAAADHLVQATGTTFGLPTLITNCSNNYGPYQFPEKLIPLMIQAALNGRPLPVYGDGMQIRDWLHVSDHCQALWRVLTAGEVGRTYCVGGNSEVPNITVVQTMCDILDDLAPRADGQSHRTSITYVTDRPGHDRRYAIDASRIADELSWEPEQTFRCGLRNTVEWYLANQSWCDRVSSGAYRGERLGLG